MAVMCNQACAMVKKSFTSLQTSTYLAHWTHVLVFASKLPHYAAALTFTVPLPVGFTNIMVL